MGYNDLMSVLIKGGEVINANGTVKRADVLISGENIAGVGDFSSYKAEKTIDANGCLVAPGFVVPVSSDKHMTLFEDPGREELLLSGITTAVLGSSGVSVAPTNYGELDSIYSWHSDGRNNADWKSTDEFLSSVSTIGSGVNLAVVSGYSTIRQSITKEHRELTEKEIDVARHIFFKSLKEGSFGMSLLTDEFSQKEFPYIFDLLKENTLWISSLLSEDNIAILDELKNKTLQGVVFSNSFFYGRKSVEKMLKEIMSIKQFPHYFSVNPFSYSEIVFADIFGSQMFKYRTLEFIEKMDGKRIKNTVTKFLSKVPADKIFIANAPSQYKFLLGKNLKEFAENRLISEEEGILRLFDISKGKMSFFAEINDLATVKELIVQDNAFLEGNWDPMGKVSFIHNQLRSSVSEFIRIGRELKLDTADIYNKLSVIPAKALGLAKRGEIKTNHIADVVVMSNDKIKDCFVSGAHSVSDGAITGERNGKVLRNV